MIPWKETLMKNKRFLTIMTACLTFFLWSPVAVATGVPHILYGKVRNSDTTLPDASSFEMYAYVTERPGEILAKTSVGCGYTINSLLDGWFWTEAGNFVTPWVIDENVRIVFSNSDLNESGYIDFVFDGTGKQLIPDLILAPGDNVGPITSNAMVDSSSSAFIPEGTNSIFLTAVLDDTYSGNSHIQVGEYFIDTDTGSGLGTAVEPVDGLYDGPYEEVRASVPTSSWTEGSIHILYVRGKDTAGNWGTTHSVSIAVTPPTYQFLGFLPPIGNEGGSVFNANKTIPVKFQLKDINNTVVYGGTASLTLQAYLEDVPAGDPIYATPSGDANTGNEFRYDAIENQYIYNLSTKSLPVGKWKLMVTMENGDRYDVFIELR